MRVLIWLLAPFFCFVSMIALGILVASIWEGWFAERISLDQFLGLRKILAIVLVVYAIYCAWRLIRSVKTPGPLTREFVRELIAYSIFWVLEPPIWFFVEYFAVQSDWIGGLPWLDKEEYLKTIKDYADYASKIWAGVLALLLALIGLKRQ